MRFVISLILLFTAFPGLAAMRDWRNAEGNQSFRAEYLASDGVRVTLKREDARIITVALAKLHEQDQAWVRDNLDPSELAADAPSPKGAAFDQLEFGDNRTTVEKKLKASKFVSAGLDGTFLGRTGLNGVFKTTNTIGGHHCFLFFDWTKSGGLREVSLQTQPVGKAQYLTSLRGTWAELIDLLNKLHGQARQSSDFPKLGDLQDGLMLGSHLWNTEEGHSVILGTGQEGLGYSVVVRITTERIRPVPVGARTSDNDSPRPKASDFQP